MRDRRSRHIEAEMRQLKIDLSELELAFDSGSEMISYYLDTETGEVVSIMEAFNATVRNRRLQEQLERAIGGCGAFRYFKDVLLDHPAERERWFQFKQDRLHQRILVWFEAQGITPYQ